MSAGCRPAPFWRRAEGQLRDDHGLPSDPNAEFLRGGQQEVLQAAIDAGEITIVGEANTDGWQPANAQANMEQILTETDNRVDAVVASNDGMAGGASRR